MVLLACIWQYSLSGANILRKILIWDEEEGGDPLVSTPVNRMMILEILYLQQ